MSQLTPIRKLDAAWPYCRVAKRHWPGWKPLHWSWGFRLRCLCGEWIDWIVAALYDRRRFVYRPEFELCANCGQPATLEFHQLSPVTSREQRRPAPARIPSAHGRTALEF